MSRFKMDEDLMRMGIIQFSDNAGDSCTAQKREPAGSADSKIVREVCRKGERCYFLCNAQLSQGLEDGGNDPTKVGVAVDFPQRKGGTHIYAGVKLANREMGYAFSVTRTGRGIKRIYFIVTDGAGTDSLQLLKESNLAKKAGVEIFTIAVGQDANKPENVKLLKRVAGTELCEVSDDLAKLDACPGDNENFIGVQDYTKLAARVQKFVDE